MKKILNTALSAALILSASPVHAVEIQIQQDITFRQIRAGHRVIGTLRAGSIIDLDLADGERQNHPNPNRPGYDQFDLRKTLQYMQSNPRAGAVSFQKIAGVNTALFKVKIVNAAPGSSTGASADLSTMIPLAALDRRGKTYVNTGDGSPTAITTGDDTQVFSGDDASSDDQTSCPGGNCNGQAGPVSDNQLDILAQLGTMAPADDSMDSDDSTSSNDTLDPETFRSGRLQGLSIPGKPLCNNFIKTDGSYGKYGKMLKEIFSKLPDYKNRTASFAAVCRNFATFSDAERLHFEIWVMAATASVESGCSPDAINYKAVKGHGPAVGLMQVEGYQTQRARAGRGAMCFPHSDIDMSEPYRNLSCAAEMIDDVTISRGYSIERAPSRRYGGQYYAALGDKGFKETIRTRRGRRTVWAKNPVPGIIAGYKDCWN